MSISSLTLYWAVPKTPLPTHPFPRTIVERSGQGQFSLVPVNVLGTSLPEITLVHRPANQLSKVLHNLGRKEHPPEPPEEPLREAPGLRAPPPGRCGGPGAGGPRLGRCAAASGEASGRPGPGYRSAGRGGMRRLACWNRQAPGPPRDGWGSRGKRRPWEGWRGTPASIAPPQRPGQGAAGACVSPCARRGGWGSAGVVLAPALAPPSSADSAIAWWWCPRGSSAPQHPMRPALGSGAGWCPDPVCRLSIARCPLPLDPPWSPGRVDEQVLQELAATEQQVGQGRSGDPGFGHQVPAAVGQG